MFLENNDKKIIKSAIKTMLNIVKSETKTLLQSGNGISLPNNPPNKRTGALANSLRITTTKLSGSITANVPYALALESGAKLYTKGSPKRVHRKINTNNAGKLRMEPRPFLSVVFEKNENNFQKRLVDALNKSIAFKDTK